MQAALARQKFRGVPCRSCGRPIRLPASILRREAQFNQSQPEPDLQWCSKVFSFRCKVCGVEAIYALSRILDFEEENIAKCQPDLC